MFALIKRNLSLYFRDRSSVFFSLMSVFVALGIYFLFLAATMEKGLEGIGNLTYLMDSWFLGGTLAIMSVTITLASYGTMVEDETSNIRKDFLASPIKRTSLALSYIISSCIIGIIMSFIVLGIGEVCIVVRGGEVLSMLAMLKVIGLILISVISSSAIMFLLASFLHSNSSYSGASTVIGTLIGFLAGLYMPIGSLPQGVQNFINFVPTTHAASLFRQVFMEEPIASGMVNFPSEAIQALKVELGTVLTFGNMTINVWMSLFFLGAVAVLFYLLSLAKMARKKV